MEELWFMLRRAAHCVIIALIAAIFGFTGILHWTAIIAQSVCVVFAVLCVLSLLFSLFEESADSTPTELPVEAPATVTANVILTVKPQPAV